MIHKNLLRAFATLVALLVVLVMAMMLGACERARPEFTVDNADEVGAMIRAGGLRYASDPNTGDCFAYAFIVKPSTTTEFSMGGAVITWVPCSAERP